MHTGWAIIDPPEPQLDRCLTRSLTDFNLEYHEPNHNISFILKGLCRALSRIKGDNSLEYLYIMVSVNASRIHEWKEVSIPHWRALDEALVGAACSEFPKLQLVNISIEDFYLEHGRDEANSTVRNSVRNFWSTALPSLHEFYKPLFGIALKSNMESTCYIHFRRREYINSEL